jgi:peptide-methionine (S)-S-oxide reductase
MEIATLAGGCFWCLEAVFQRVRGVSRVTPGYTGGHDPHPTYQAVCSGASGHAEAVQLGFDPAVISFRELLEIFFTLHDPTTPNRQGPDVGTQYRSAVFVHSPEQERIAREVIAEFEREKVWVDPIVTEIALAGTFHPAEPFHVRYYDRNPDQLYCRIQIAPKVAKLRQLFLNRLQETA